MQKRTLGTPGLEVSPLGDRYPEAMQRMIDR